MDRNLLVGFWCLFGFVSLSARRAWIEIEELLQALSSSLRRSPQGERG